MASGISEARYFLFAENKFGFILFSRAPLDRLTGADEYKIWKIQLLLPQTLFHPPQRLLLYNERLRLRLRQQQGWQRQRGAAR